MLGILTLLSNYSFGQPTAAFFYGKNVPALQLCMYDMVVVDPYSNFNPDEYCKSISLPIAYVSVGEVAQDAPYVKDIKPEWVIGKNTAWNNNFVIDQSQKGWQDYFISQKIDPLWKKGYRGFFLDTLDSYFLATHDPQQQQKQIDNIANLIQQIKKRYPEAKIILNRGFQLLPQVHSQVDAVVIESLYNAWNQAKRIYENTPLADQKMLLEQISKIKQMQLPIIIIDYLPPAQQNKAQGLADTLIQQGFIPWITDSSLQELYLNKAREVPRKILMVFRNQANFSLLYIANFGRADIILEYMGYILKYINLEENTPLPAGDLSQQYSGIIVFIDTPDAKNMPLFQWVQKQIASKIPVVFINSFAIPVDSPELSKLNVSASPIETPNTSIQITKMNPQYIGYEMKPTTSPFDFYPTHTNSGEVLLQLKSNKQQTEDAAAITPWGGYVLSPYYIQYLPNSRGFWVINPFEFLKKALRLRDLPVPDTTTENGRRLMSVHIDGDGFFLQAKWIGGRFAGAELRDLILKRFRIPTSVSVITGEIAPNGANPKLSPQLMDIARSIFALPWVEIASHSFSHPFNWRKHTDDAGQIQGESYTVKIPGYQCNLETEIAGSVDFINQYLAPANKKCNLIFWSGMADPNAIALGIAARNKILNINGMPDTYIDNNYPSLTGVQPMGAEIDGYYQVFSPVDGDFYYMNGLAGPMYGFEKVIQTLSLTDKPRRLKPIDLYYHIYSAGYPAALEALIKVYNWALAQPVMNIYISEYIKKVLDYFQIKIIPRNDSWILNSNGDLRELRSLSTFGYPNLIKSQNVIGFKIINGDVYIHLGPNQFTVLNYQKEKPTQPYLVEANARVTAFSRIQNQLIITLEGHMPLQFTLDNVGKCQVSAKNPLKMTPNQDNTVSYSSDKERDEIHINCL